MAGNPGDKLIIAISSRALFNLDESHAVYERDGLPAEEAQRAAVTAISAFEGALIVARVRKSSEPILMTAQALQKLGTN